MSTLNIVGLAGSLRRGAFTRQMMETLPDLAPEGMRITLADIGHLPFYNEDLKEDGKGPEVVRAFNRLIGEADGLIVGSPEYNRSPPAVLKNAIDWLSKEPEAVLAGKPVMEDESTLAECGVTDGATVHLSVKIRGGGGDEEPGPSREAGDGGAGRGAGRASRPASFVPGVSGGPWVRPAW